METKFNLKQLITSYTRVTQHSSTIIDRVYSDSNKVSSSGIIDVNISDHFAVFLVRKKGRNRIEKHCTYGRSYLRYDKDTFGRLLLRQGWTSFDNSTNVTEMWNQMETNIPSSLDQICPIRKLLVSDTKPEWLNNNIIQLMRKRDVAYRKARNSKSDVDWRKATFFRNQIENGIKQFKKRKITDSFTRNRNNPNKFWKDIRTILPNDKTVEVTSLKDEETGQTLEGGELSEHINNYFANVGSKLANVIIGKRRNNPTIHTKTQLVLNSDSDGVTNHEITEDELRKALKLIDVRKSSALLHIRTNIIFDSIDYVLDRFLRMFNLSLINSEFPHLWKISIVVQLPKVSNPITATDLRPISLIPLPGKILEHIISKRLKMFLTNNNILVSNQHGFRKAHSMITSICTLLGDIYSNVNEFKETFLIFKKAFDTVSHEILINKLGGYGLDLRTVDWFSSYLSDRTQYVRFNNVNSSLLTTEYGVPQESILGPTLFSLYINNIVSMSCKNNIILYADDTVLYSSDFGKMQIMLHEVADWCDNNLLTINCKKSQWMHTSVLNGNISHYNFKLGTQDLERVSEYKYLGLILGKEL